MMPCIIVDHLCPEKMYPRRISQSQYKDRFIFVAGILTPSYTKQIAVSWLSMIEFIENLSFPISGIIICTFEPRHNREIIKPNIKRILIASVGNIINAIAINSLTKLTFYKVRLSADRAFVFITRNIHTIFIQKPCTHASRRVNFGISLVRKKENKGN